MKKEAIEYLVLAGKKDEAFNMALTYGEMETYSNALKDPLPTEYITVA